MKATLRVRSRFSASVASLLCLALGWRRADAAPRRPTARSRSNSRATPAADNAETKTGELTGNVIITQGTMTIRADRIDVQAERGQFAVGDRLRQSGSLPPEKRDGADEYYEGYAQRIVYDGSKRLVELFDSALLKKAATRSAATTSPTTPRPRSSRPRADRTPSRPVAGEVPLARACAARSSPEATTRGAKPASKEQALTRSAGQRTKGTEPPSDKPAPRRAAAAPSTLQPSGDLAPAKSSKLSAAAACERRYKARTVVHDVSLDVASGEVVGLLGPNGAGKTTCFYMIVGLVAADGGRIALDGENLSRLPIHQRARRGLSYLPQEASIFRKLTVAENVRAILELQDLDADTSVQPPRRAARGPVDLAPGRLPPRSRCRAASGGAARSRARWRRGRASSCSTSRSPASTRSPCSTSRRSSASSRSAASAC